MTKRKKAVVYTALVGAYDYLRPVPKGFSDIDFVCFSDSSLSETYCESKGWKLRGLPEGEGSSRSVCRQLKSMPHLYLDSYDISVWVDSNVSFSSGIGPLIDEFINSEALIRCFRHPSRKCAYLEAEECIRQGKDNESNVNSMVKHMRSSGFPEGYGLTETNVLFRKHNEKNVLSLNEDWSKFLTEITIRDQLSFDYLCWLYEIAPWYFSGSTHRNEHPVFSRGLHRSANKLKDFFAYIESFQGIYPPLRSVINFLYTKIG